MGYFTGIQASEEIDRAVEAMRGAVPDCAQEALVGVRGQTHITLAHLGRQLPDTSNFEQIGMASMPFEISIDGAAIFRNHRTTHLVLPVTKGNDELQMLELKMRKQSRSPARTYNGHLTVATIPTDAKNESIGYRKMIAFREKYGKQHWGRMVVTSFQLFTSTKGRCRISDRWHLTGREEVM